MPADARTTSAAAAGNAGHLPVLTAIRGLAAWWVVLFHFKHFLFPHIPGWAEALISRGDLAVDLFFCLSGFVIYVNYYKLQMNAKAVTAFYVKRLARVYPLHLLVLVLYGCLALTVLRFSSLHRVDSRFGLWSLIANLLLMQDWGIVPALSWNVPGWSISAEFAAYLGFPLLLGALKYRQSRPLRLAVTAALALGAVGLVFSLSHAGLGANITSLGAMRCVCQFAAGMALAEAYRRRAAWMSGYAWVPLGAGLGLFLCCVRFDLPTALVVPPAWACLIFGLALDRTALSAILSARPLVWGGEVSYATYMCHYFVYDVFKLAAVGDDMTAPVAPILLAFAAIAVWSAILYRYVERPCQAWLVKSILSRKPAPARVEPVCEGVSQPDRTERDLRDGQRGRQQIGTSADRLEGVP